MDESSGRIFFNKHIKIFMRNVLKVTGKENKTVIDMGAT